MRMKFLSLTLLSAFLMTGPSSAESTHSVHQIKRNSPYHTEIILHNTAPAAQAARNKQVENALQRREREKERAHEIELAKIRAEAELEKTRIAKKPAPQPPRRVVRDERPHYFNGGRFTGFSGPVFGGYGFGGYGSYGGYGYRGYGYRGYRGYGYGRRGYRGYGFARRGFHRGYSRGYRCR